MWRPCRTALPHQTWSFAPSAIGFVTGAEIAVLSCIGPPKPTSQLPTHSAIQLSMIVVITSCAPTVARRMPAIPPQTAPASIAAVTASTTCGTAGMPANQTPI